MSDLKEFAADSREAAVERAARFFGTSPERLEVRIVSDHIEVSGLGDRVLVLTSPKLEPVELGPIGEFVEQMLGRMRLRGDVRVDEQKREDGEVSISLRGAGIEPLVRRERRLADALSHIVSRAAQNLMENAPRVTVQIGAGGGAGARAGASGEARLEQLAKTKAEEARRAGKPVELSPMNSRERWVIHNALKQEAGVRSQSVGDGRQKRVRISPA